MDQKKRSDLLEVIHLAEAGYIDADYIEQWKRFKEHLTLGDKAKWQILIDQVNKKPDGTVELFPPLSDEEKIWAKGIIMMAERLNLC
jgi:hypothetical protein